MVGAYGVKNNSGAVYVFVRSGTTWTQQAKIVPADVEPSDNFGNTVAVLGDTAAIGSPRRGRVYVYVRSGTTWSLQAMLTAATDLDGGVLAPDLLAAASSEHSRIYLFERSGTTWSQSAELAPSDVGFNRFGSSLSLSGPRLLVGAREDSDVEVNAGSAYVFRCP